MRFAEAGIGREDPPEPDKAPVRLFVALLHEGDQLSRLVDGGFRSANTRLHDLEQASRCAGRRRRKVIAHEAGIQVERKARPSLMYAIIRNLPYKRGIRVYPGAVRAHEQWAVLDVRLQETAKRPHPRVAACV